MERKFGYFVKITEYERGWGQRPEGYYVFDSEESADGYIKWQYSKRGNVVPECYLDYKKVGWHPITAAQLTAIYPNKHVWQEKI